MRSHAARLGGQKMDNLLLYFLFDVNDGDGETRIWAVLVTDELRVVR